MSRSWLIAAGTGAILFATTDLAFNALAEWLAKSEHLAASAIVNEIFLRVFPAALAGLAAGYRAMPHGFSAAAVAGFAGAVISLSFRSQDGFGWALAAGYNMAAMIGWFTAMAITTGIGGWAGERLRSK